MASPIDPLDPSNKVHGPTSPSHFWSQNLLAKQASPRDHLDHKICSQTTYKFVAYLLFKQTQAAPWEGSCHPLGSTNGRHGI